MLRKVTSTSAKVQRVSRNSHSRFAIVASTYNAKYVDAMCRAAQKTLKQAGAVEIKVVRVPGAFEIPTVAAALARQSPPWSAIICLGVILRGETTHAQHIGDTVSRLLGQLGVDTGTPIIHEVLLLENTAQADKRCLDRNHNRGTEAAQTALAMAVILDDLKPIPF